MRISLKGKYRSLSELTATINNYFTNYTIGNGVIKIYYHKHQIATIYLENMILEANIRAINHMGDIKENLSICRKLDIIACV